MPGDRKLGLGPFHRPAVDKRRQGGRLVPEAKTQGVHGTTDTRSRVQIIWELQRRFGARVSNRFVCITPILPAEDMLKPQGKQG